MKLTNSIYSLTYKLNNDESIECEHESYVTIDQMHGKQLNFIFLSDKCSFVYHCYSDSLVMANKLTEFREIILYHLYVL